MDIDNKERKDIILPLAATAVHAVVATKIYCLWEPPCFWRRWVVFSFLKRSLWNTNALVARMNPLKTSFNIYLKDHAY